MATSDTFYYTAKQRKSEEDGLYILYIFNKLIILFLFYMCKRLTFCIKITISFPLFA